MAYIELTSRLPGISGLLDTFPETGRALGQLAQVLLRGESTLTEGERELIASYVSSKNDCFFCKSSHGAAAKHLLDVDYDFIGRVQKDFESADISDKMKSLLAIAGQVQQGGLHVTEESVGKARDRGATDREIHDTILIASAFCMYNRYVDGLGTWAPDEVEAYDESGARLAEQGYTGI